MDYVRKKLVEHGVDPTLICFEITETSAVENIDNARQFVQALKLQGCRFSLDDFGTGMSSYAYLKHLPVDYIKIDGSFIREILDSEIDRVMVEMIVKMARVMNMTVIAECVESEAIMDVLTKMNVGFAQGYAIARPALFA
ncbi:EAL domain-containing protein [Tardiphaga sp. OK246]|uniref:EAL domain-containing protein n=1 Tax=Tardiphaga sp. OK246 TaxID=1855307 RepID=UPI001FCD28A6